VPDELMIMKKGTTPPSVLKTSSLRYNPLTMCCFTKHTIAIQIEAQVGKEHEHVSFEELFETLTAKANLWVRLE